MFFLFAVLYVAYGLFSFFSQRDTLRACFTETHGCEGAQVDTFLETLGVGEWTDLACGNVQLVLKTFGFMKAATI